MKAPARQPRGLVAIVVALTLGSSTFAAAQSQGILSEIADNEGLFVDGKAFTITPGKVKNDASPRIETLGAHELAGGAVIFRANGKLYVLDAPLPPRTSRPDRQLADVGASPVQVDRVRIEYVQPKDPQHQMLYENLKQRQALEMLQRILSPFQFPIELTIKTMGCDGLADSWFSYDHSMPTIHLCYELLQEIIKTMPTETTPILKIAPHDAVVGQFLFWSLHEVGHAVFHIFDVPLFGREEDAADQFSVYMMLHFGKDQAHRLVEGAVYAARRFVVDYKENPEVQKRLENFSSVHGLPEQRFYNGLCLAFGADAPLFADVVATGLLPKIRAEHCQHEYETFDYAFKTIIKPHIDRQMAKAVWNIAWFSEQPSQPFPK
jgi:Putative metallopeptidase